jgi:hypothetical protein
MNLVTIVLAQALGAAQLWNALPLVVSVSLVYAATRHEEMKPILQHALRFGIWVLIFMLVVLGVVLWLGALV